jgi:hypothetical protein
MTIRLLRISAAHERVKSGAECGGPFFLGGECHVLAGVTLCHDGDQ